MKDSSPPATDSRGFRVASGACLKRALVFCPEIDGHRQNYCCVVSDWFLRSGYSVILAAGRSFEGQLAADTPLIGMLARRPGITVLDLGDTSNSHLVHGRWTGSLKEIEERYSPEWTFFPTGDEMRISLGGLGAVPGSGHFRRAAIFIHSDWLYPRDLSGEDLFARPYRWARREAYRLKHLLFFRYGVWRDLGLQVAFSTDPHFPYRWMRGRFHYLPEIYRAWNFEIPSADEPIHRLCQEYRAFLARHPGKQVILYWGGWTARRGYGQLMQLVSQEPDTLFVSCGRPIPGDSFRYDPSSPREQLTAQDRIFELELPFLPENEFTDLLYRSCDFILLPYGDFYGLSGILVQATSYGKPVLVPSVGYMNSMVAEHKIGLAFRHKDQSDFYQQFRILRESFHLYEDAAAEFGSRFTLEAVQGALAGALLRPARR